MREQLQEKELYFLAKLKQREQEFAIKADARATELQKQWGAELRVRKEEWERQTDTRVRAVESRLALEAQQREELFQAKFRQRDQQWEVKLESVRAETKSQNEEQFQTKSWQRERELAAQFTAQTEAHLAAARTQWEAESDKKMRAAIEPFRALLARTEKERDEARQSANDSARQVETLEAQLNEASSFLSSWKNGKKLVGA